MPDISMCQNKTCSIRNRCYRFRAEPNPYRQSYADFKPTEDGCDSYWPVASASTPLKPLNQTSDEKN